MVANDAPRVDPCATGELVMHHVVGERRPDGRMHEAESCGEVEVVAGALGVVGAECAVEHGNDIGEWFTGSQRLSRSHRW